MKKFVGSTYFAFVLALLYIPVAVMIIFSFNKGTSIDIFNGWSLKWYENFIHNSPFLKSIITSLFVAVTSTLISLLVGVTAVICLWKMPVKKTKKWFQISNIPLINADVITAVSLMVIFLLMGLKFGVVTLVASHISFNVPYVIITVLPFARRIDRNLIAASRDLGSSEIQTVFKVVLPILKPAIITATFICFAMSFDDFIISYFTSGTETNFSTFIYTAKRVQPYINAFGTILVSLIFLLILIWNVYKVFQQKIADEKIKIKKGEYKLKKISHIKKQIEELEYSLKNGTKNRYSRSIKWWQKYFSLKNKLKFLKVKNYNTKISKLEWKKELLTNEIRSEKRILRIYEVAKLKQEQLQQQLEKNPDSHRAPRFQTAINKLSNKMIKLEKELDWFAERKEHDKEKAEHLNDLINSLKTEMINNDNLTKKDIQWYMKRISDYTLKRNIFLEGKNQYRLRLTLEKLSQLKSNNLEAIQKVYERLTEVEEHIFKTVSLTEKIDRKILIAEEKQIDKNEINTLQEERVNELTSIKEALKWKILYYEEKLKTIEIERLRKYRKYFIDTDTESLRSKNWVQRSWKGISLTGLFAISFGGLTAAYVINNTFDIVIGNWGSYIDMSLIKTFEKKYNVHVNYQQYDSNESLYNKLRTMNYDVMVPSDYMAERLASEEYLENIDWDKINGLNDPISKNISSDKSNVSSSLQKILGVETDGEKPKRGLLDYVVPYFWGDVRLVFNTENKTVVNFLKTNGYKVSNMDDDGEKYITNVDWSIIQKAADSGLEVDLSDDAKNLFMIGNQLANFSGVEPDVKNIDTVKSVLKNLINHNNVSLLGDQLITQISDGRFDVAVAYNGDIMYGESEHMGLEDFDNSSKVEYPYAFAVPSTTNVWSDNMVINKNNRNTDLSYKFINFIIDNSSYLSTYVGYPVASENVINNLTNDGILKYFKNIYTPTSSDGGKRYTFDEKRDNLIVKAYNDIIASKN